MCATCGCGTDPGTNDQEHEHGAMHDHGQAPGHHGAHQAHGHAHLHAHGAGQIARGVRRAVALRRTPRTVQLEVDLLAKNNGRASQNRAALAERRITALNFMSAPGAGKTTLLERTIARLSSELPVAVIEGDQETDRDAARIRAAGCKVVQLNTGTGCHLDAEMVASGLAALDPAPRSLLLIENVGNLVCPALFDLGEQRRVVVMSVTEGEDKPLKYPHMFRAAGILVLSKMDLLPHLRFDLEECLDHARRVNPRLLIFPVSATRGDGMDDWCGWLRTELQREVQG